MRVASTQYHSYMNLALATANARSGELIQQMSSGNKLLRPSDDPIASIRLLRLEREEAALTQYRDNIGALRARLSLNESYLSGMGRDMLGARDQLLMALEASYTNVDLRDMATPLAALRDSLLYSANTQDQEGRYLFSGSAFTTPAVAVDATQPAGSRYSFAGNTDSMPVEVGHGVTQPSNVTVPELPALLNQLDATIALLTSPTLDHANPAVNAQLRTTLAALDQVHGATGSKIAQLGGAQNTLKMLDDNHGNVSLSNQINMGELSSLDYAEAQVALNGYVLALQASQKAYGRVSQLSLFDVL